ncbi:MAG: serine hydrolase domain-containing protein [Parasphingorhabdus sp.]|uniref:serine hydrolase domain-containing protein n=1 Tax=Parasphingorhabdus sp. TaxID=2709688 RepID=UPI0032970B7C
MFTKMITKAILLPSFVVASMSSSVAGAEAGTSPENAPFPLASFDNAIVSLKDRNEANAKRWTVIERMKAYYVPGASVAIIRNGKVIMTKGYGTQSANSGNAVDGQTVFSAGSVSKVVNAALVLRLVQAGILDLDKDVNHYLKSWKVPESKYTAIEKVTLRRLLAHTSGLSQHGFPDFQPGEKLPTIVQTLNGKSPAKHGRIKSLFTPGEKMKYSGGGITVAQLVIEDVTGLTYNEAAEKYVFEPLAMTRSTFANPLPETHGNIARAHDKKGKAVALPRGYQAMPELAASGLWTSAEDLGKFVLGMMDEEFLSNELRNDMQTRQGKSWHGLGPRLNGIGDKLAFHHGGANDSYKSWIEGHPVQKNGIVVLTNGENGRELGYELRIAAEKAWHWSINFPADFATPQFQ